MDSNGGVVLLGVGTDIRESAGVASSVFWGKKAVMLLWGRLGSGIGWSSRCVGRWSLSRSWGSLSCWSL